MKLLLFLPVSAVGVIAVVAALYLISPEHDPIRHTVPDTEKSAPTAIPLHDAVGQMLMIGFRGDTITDESISVMRDIRPGGVILFDYDLPSGGNAVRNITSPEQLRSFTADLQSLSAVPLFISVDAEGGSVNRLKRQYGFSAALPSAEKLGAQSPEETGRAAEALAVELRDNGINWNFAPVTDVNINPDSPAIGGIQRSFSDDPTVVVSHADAFIRALRKHNVIPTLKHFPGHGSADNDTHLGVADVTESYRYDSEIAPYRDLIAGGYTDPVMTAHIVNRNLDTDGLPGTLSRPITTALLRETLGFTGVVISDDMQMGAIVNTYGLADAAVMAVQAGVDIVLLSNNHAGEYDIQDVYTVRDAIVRAAENNTLSREQLYASVDRILALKKQYGITR